MAMWIASVIGGLIPVLPYVILPAVTAMPVSIAGTMLALLTFGGLKGQVVKQVW
jgi:VIT1/CCC1 family predicted Fe2+/Mn2+ transporter